MYLPLTITLIDGSQPTEKSNKYISEIEIAETSTLKYFAIDKVAEVTLDANKTTIVLGKNSDKLAEVLKVLSDDEGIKWTFNGENIK
ncbi:chitobiase/beta-hexosaminidase C-terminal domain-containing protein [Clostridium sp. DL1XJH146]